MPTMTFRQTACFTPAGQHKHEKHFILNKWLRRSLRHLVFQLKFNYKKSAEIPLCTVFHCINSSVKRTLIAFPHELLALFLTDDYCSPARVPIPLPRRY